MTVAKKIALIIGIAVLVALIPEFIAGFLYALFTGDDAGDRYAWLRVLSRVTALLFLLGGIIYIAVDAALRHNSAPGRD